MTRHHRTTLAILGTACALFTCPWILAAQGSGFLTDFERSGGTATPDFEHTMRFLHRLEKASPWIRVSSFGITPQGRALPLVILSKDRAFTPARARALRKPVILVQSGIHAGEIDGKDASLMLLRDIAVTRSLSGLADHAVLVFMPIFNLDGHERRGRYNRINQDGPVETGWRTTSQNLNLNRDYLKADAPEMRAWLAAWNAWQPDFLIDIHVTDGIDFQYNLTYSMEMFENAPPGIVAWQRALERSMTAGMEAQGDPVFPYVFPREDNDLSRGLLTYAAPPRFSTGYAAVRNRAALLVETHMLKPYARRVESVRRLLVAILRFVNADPAALTAASRAADDETVRMFSAVRDTAWFPIDFDATQASHPVTFNGYASTLQHSAISGGTYQVWDHAKPVTVTVPYFDDVRPTQRIRAPLCYVIPEEFGQALDVLRLHGVRLERLASPATLPVETTVLSNPKWRGTPYEGRHPVTCDAAPRRDTLRYPAGTYIVRLAQRSARAAVNLLEPRAPDSFVSWGFFDAVFEQKEYFESYVMEPIAARMLAERPGLKAAFDARLAADSLFARNPRARLDFFYERSPWADPKLDVYPVGRYFGGAVFESVPEESYRHGKRRART